MPTILHRFENDHVVFTLHDDASALLVGKHTNTTWRMGPVALQEDGPIDVGHVWLRTGRSICEQYPGRFRGEALGDGRVRWTLLGRPRRREVGTFVTRYALDGPWLEVRIEEVDASLPSLVFPPPIESDSLVFPMGVGRWVRKPLSGRFFWTFYSQLNMRWFGGLRADANDANRHDVGWLCVFSDGHADAGVLAADLTASPGWRQSLDRWPDDPPRAVRYRFTTGGYVGLAKAYRAWAIDHGLHTSLAEKFETVPASRNLLGGRILSFMQARTYNSSRDENRLRRVSDDDRRRDGTVEVHVSHSDAARIIRDARELGMRRGLVVVRGWIRGGYDESHPDVWPPEPALGPVEQLRDLTANTSDPFVVALHDNYQDIYEQSPSFPRGIVQDATGKLMAGGIWAGGQAYILNARDGLAHARRNWAHHIKPTLAPRAMFIDTTTAANLYQSFEPGNTLTRAQDEQLKVELLRLYRDAGQVLGNEEAADFGVPQLDWFENRHKRAAGGESVPLWPLVFHDAAFCARYGDFWAEYGPGTDPTGPGAPPPWLTDMLWGYMLMVGVRDVPKWDAGRERFRGTLHVDDWHARVGAADVIGHRYLTEVGQVEQTEFSSGAAIACNFAAEPRTVDGVTVPPHGYVIRD